jgi:thioredoxin-like negative regulator of GroEL
MSLLLLTLILVAAGLLVWKLWKPLVRPPKKEVAPNEAHIYFFYTNWCGHSKKAMPEWEKFEKAIKGKTFGKTKVVPVRVDAEEDVPTATLYDVQAYPTVLLETGEGIAPYERRVTESGLVQFLRNKLGEERSGL